MRGTGTQQDPFLIDNLTDLNNVRNNLSAYYKVAAHIDATATQTWNNGAGFDPIDDFAGYFDGDFKNISGLYINRETDSNGLFGNIAEGATITKVVLSNVNITGANHTGALVGYDVVNSTITKCCASGTVVGNGVNIGGLIGTATTGTVVISECFSLVNVTGSPTGTATGGLIGAFGGTGSVQNCYAKGSVNGVPSIGAFIGSASNATIKYCYSVGPVSGTSGSYSTGFCGYGFNLTTDGTNFFDKETTGKSSGFGATGKTTFQMHTIGTYDGWDFDVVWQWNPANYPTLRNVPESYLVVTPEIPIEDSPYTRISYNPVGTLIEDELHTDVGAESFNLNHDTFYAGTDLEIWTGPGKTGTQLVQDTDYTVGDEDTRLSTKTTKNVFTSITITNATYQTGSLYITYKTVGDYAVAEDINAAIEKVLTPQIKVDLTNPEMVPTWPFILNHTKNHVLEFPSDEAYAVCCDDKYVYVGISPSSIIKIDAYTKEQVLRVDTDQFPPYVPTYMFRLGNYLFVTNLAEEIIKYDTDTLTEIGRSQSYNIVGLTADYDYFYCLEKDLNLELAIIDPGTMEEIQSIVVNDRIRDGIIVVEDNTPLIVCGRDGLVFRGRDLESSRPRLIWISRTSPLWVRVSNFLADVYPTGTIFFQDDSDRFFSIDQRSNRSTIVRVGAYDVTNMLTFSSNGGFENIKATTDGKYVYFVGNSNDPSALIVIKYDPVKNKAMKKTVQDNLIPKAVTSNGRQLIILCTYKNSGRARLLFLNDRLEEEVEP